MNPNEQLKPEVQPTQPQAQPQPQVQPFTQSTPPQYNQAGTPDTVSFQEQPKVQYVVMQKSLEGLGGWLAFFIVVSSLSAIGYFSWTFNREFGVQTFTDLFLALGYITSVALVALRKRIALWFIYATIILSFLVAVGNTLVDSGSKGAGEVAGVIMVSFIFHGLLGLYFYTSKRVKATLTK